MSFFGPSIVTGWREMAINERELIGTNLRPKNFLLEDLLILLTFLLAHPI